TYLARHRHHGRIHRAPGAGHHGKQSSRISLPRPHCGLLYSSNTRDADHSLHPSTWKTPIVMLNIVLITGISGSGKSVALRLLEDAGYTCVDNLPVRFLHEFIASTRESGLERVAVSIDVRSPGELNELPDVITGLRAM